MNASLPWRRASEIQPKPGDGYLAAYSDAQEGDPPQWRYLAGTVQRDPRRDRLVVADEDYVPYEFENDIAWEYVEWVVPLDLVAETIPGPEAPQER